MRKIDFVNVKKSLGYTFEQWKYHVDSYIYKQTGLDSESLPDFDYREAYEENTSAHVAGKWAIQNAEDY